MRSADHTYTFIDSYKIYPQIRAFKNVNKTNMNMTNRNTEKYLSKCVKSQRARGKGVISQTAIKRGRRTFVFWFPPIIAKNFEYKIYYTGYLQYKLLKIIYAFIINVTGCIYWRLVFILGLFLNSNIYCGVIFQPKGNTN